MEVNSFQIVLIYVTLYIVPLELEGAKLPLCKVAV